jgi:hypothetical protein
MKKGASIAFLLVLGSALIGCGAGGDVTADGATNSYNEQEKKAEALAKQRGETTQPMTTDQSEN